MSTHAAAGRSTSFGAIAPPLGGILTTNSSDPNLKPFNNGVGYTIDTPVRDPVKPMSFNFTGGLSTGIKFSGTYDFSSGSIKFSMTITHVLYEFSGSITKDEEKMGGAIFNNQLMGRPSGHAKTGGVGDDGSWSAQAPPHTDDDDRPRPARPHCGEGATRVRRA